MKSSGAEVIVRVMRLERAMRSGPAEVNLAGWTNWPYCAGNKGSH